MITPRLQYLIEHYSESLINRLSANLTNKLSQDSLIGKLSQETVLTVSNAVLKFSLSDPSRNKSATQWLITTYLNDGFRFEDMLGDNTSKVHNTLVQFGLYRGKLDVSSRSLNQYKTLADVYASIEAFIPKDNDDLTLSGKALKRSEREKAHQETEFIHQGEDGFTVVSPKTEFASKWWGKGTQWCTASDNNNMFQHYNKEAPLLIIIMPNGDKLQLHVGKYEFQFMDARDQDVEKSYIENNWNVLGPIMFTSVKQNGYTLQFVPEEFRNKELYLSATKQNGVALYYVPEELRDKNLCWSAIKQNGVALYYVPKELKDKEICWEAVKQTGKALGYVPEELRDREICWEAVKQTGEALGYVPEEFRDLKLCLEAVKSNGLALQYVPVELRYREICLEAIKQNGRALEHVLKELRDREMCLEAVRQTGWAIEYVPWKLRYREICLEAVKQSGYALWNVPKELRDREMCLEAVKQDGLAIELVSEKLRDIEICLEAVRQNGGALRFVPEELKSICLDSMTKIKEDNV
jgi:hypothetical protein